MCDKGEENILKIFFIRRWIFIFILIGLFSHVTTFAQGLDALNYKVGRIWGTVTATGSNNSAVRPTSGWFPSDLNIAAWHGGEGNAGTGGAVLYMRNFSTPDSFHQEFKSSPTDEDFPEGVVIEPIKSYIRYDYPYSSINGNPVETVQLGDIAPDKMIGSSDQIITSTYEYPLVGVHCERKVMCWSQEYHDDYVVVDFTFTNKSDQTLQDVIISLSFEPVPKAYSWGHNPEPQFLTPEWTQWWHYYGAREADSQRVYYAYHADDPKQGGDTMGLPAQDQQGRLILPGATFWGFLHASKQPYSDPAQDENDPLQPITTYVSKGAVEGKEIGEEYDAAFGTFADQNPMPGIPEGTHHEMNNDESGSADFQAFSPYVAYISGNKPHASFGPYATWEPGKSLRLIYVIGHTGLSLPMAKKIGKELVNGTIEPPPGLPHPEKGFFPANFVFPEGATEADIKKDLWLSTVIDSVHQTMYRARWNFNRDWNVPAAPPPPSVETTGKPGYVEIKWSDPEAEALPNFAGYRIFRKKSNLDTAFFEIIYESGAEDRAAEHLYQDRNVQFGASYYYYVQAAVRVDPNDPNALPDVRGKKLWSGRAYIPTILSLEPPKGAAQDLSNVVVAPNPYNFNDPNVVEAGWAGRRGVVFFNIMPYTEIDIFTEDGDKVKSIVHNSSEGAGSYTWDLLTDSQQVVNSGVYIATFKSQNGEVAYRKFVIAR